MAGVLCEIHSRADYRDFVQENLKVGNVIRARRDRWGDKGHGMLRRRIVEFHPTYVVTVDPYTRRETFDYLELYEILMEKGKCKDDELFDEEKEYLLKEDSGTKRIRTVRDR